MTPKEPGREGVVEPWCDTELCDKCGGPITPMHHDSPTTAPDVRHVFCVACGKDYLETNGPKLVRIWWSAGAYEGQQVEERHAKARGRP